MTTIPKSQPESPLATAAAKWLQDAFDHFHRRELVHPDPLECLYDYADVADREVAALIAACLAYGNVRSILGAVRRVLGALGPAPAHSLKQLTPEALQGQFSGFRYRFTSDSQLVSLLLAIRQVCCRFGSLQDCLASHCSPSDTTVREGLNFLAGQLRAASETRLEHLVPLPQDGSACKRLNLFLRWMVRRDAVDPGGWQCALPSQLIVPVDVHVHRISLRMGWTRRKQVDWTTALEITEAWRWVDPNDPVRFDFSVTRVGMQRTASPTGQ